MDKYCRICRNKSCSNHGKDISFLGGGWQCNYIPVPTNADRIRNWNDHELAETIANFVSEIDNGDVRYSDDPNDLLKWLQQPAE